MIRVFSAVSLAALLLLLAVPAAFADGAETFFGPHYVVSGETRLAVPPFAGEGDAPVYTDYHKASGVATTDADTLRADADTLRAEMQAAGGS